MPKHLRDAHPTDPRPYHTTHTPLYPHHTLKYTVQTPSSLTRPALSSLLTHATLNHNDIRPPSHACTPQRCTLYRPITMTNNPRTSTSCTTHSEHPYIALSPRSPCVLFSPCNTEAQRPHITIPCLNTSEMHILSTHDHTIRHPHPYTRPYTQSTLYRPHILSAEPAPCAYRSLPAACTHDNQMAVHITWHAHDSDTMACIAIAQTLSPTVGLELG